MDYRRPEVPLTGFQREQFASSMNLERHDELAVLDALFASAPVGLGVVDRDLRYIKINEVLADLHGSPARDHIGHFVRDCFKPNADQVESALKEVLVSGLPVLNREFEYPSREKSNPTRTVIATYYPIRDNTNEVVAIGKVVVDVTERKAMVNALRDSEQRLLRAQDLRDRFVGALTHDLRNPLSSAKMSAEILLRQGSPEPVQIKKHLTKVLESLDRTNRMIENLLDANRIQGGDPIPLKFEACDLRAVLQAAATDLSLVHGDRFVVDAVSAVEGSWSEDGLRRVIENLASNAVKYGFKETPITLSLKHLGTHAELRVHNFGGELSQEDQKGLFHLFQRTRTAVDSGQKGWGIGLTLVKGIVEAHGGRIFVESALGEGTSFVVSLPLTPAR